VAAQERDALALVRDYGGTVAMTPPTPDGPIGCTCHPSERPEPCQHKYALTDCIEAANGPIAVEELVAELGVAAFDMQTLETEQKDAMESATGFSANACGHLYSTAAKALTTLSADLAAMRRVLTETREVIIRYDGYSEDGPVIRAIDAALGASRKGSGGDTL